MLFERNGKILFTGDSITDAGRARPAGVGAALGVGYVNYVNALLQTSYPGAGYTVLNSGGSGDTVRLLAKRWQTDVLDLSPDYLSIMIGVNDVWRRFDRPDDPSAAVGIDEYTGTYSSLISRTLPAVKKIILVTPFMCEPDKDEPMRAYLEAYISAVRKLAADNGLILVDMQKTFEEYMDGGTDPKVLSGDRVHPSPVGAMIIAKSVLAAAGFVY